MNDKEKAVLKKLSKVAKSIKGDISDKKKSDKPVVFKLDKEDSLMLDNTLLKQQVAKMSVMLAEKQAAEAQALLQNHLIAKFKVDSSKNQLQVDPIKQTVTIVPR